MTSGAMVGERAVRDIRIIADLGRARTGLLTAGYRVRLYELPQDYDRAVRVHGLIPEFDLKQPLIV